MAYGLSAKGPFSVVMTVEAKNADTGSGLLDLSNITGGLETVMGIKAGVYGTISVWHELTNAWSSQQCEWWDVMKRTMPPLNSWLGSSTIRVETFPSHVVPVGGSIALAAAASFLSLVTGTPVVPGAAMTGGVSQRA